MPNKILRAVASSSTLMRSQTLTIEAVLAIEAMLIIQIMGLRDRDPLSAEERSPEG